MKAQDKLALKNEASKKYPDGEEDAMALQL
jgi:hypothetical protein